MTLFLSNPKSFGTGSPKWTIGSSRSDNRTQVTIPGPGYYDWQSNEKRSIGHQITDRGITKYDTSTSNIDFRMTHEFPKLKPVTIGINDGRGYIPKVESPDPSYSPPVFGSDTTARIYERHEPKDRTSLPGPGSYSPVFSANHRSPGYVMPRIPNTRHSNPELHPGPGSYNITSDIKPAPKWTNKFRVHFKRLKRGSEGLVWKNDNTFLAREKT